MASRWGFDGRSLMGTDGDHLSGLLVFLKVSVFEK